jgi:hypothetical protein
MAKKSKNSLPSPDPTPARNPGRGAPLTLTSLPTLNRGSIRGIARSLVGHHTTEIAMRIREGMLSENLRLALKYLQFVGDRTDGKPVETHRMVGLQEGPQGSYDLSKLGVKEQQQLLKLLREARDTTTSKGEA